MAGINSTDTNRNKSALAFSHWETYYYRVVQSQTVCMLLLSLYFYSPYTLHTQLFYACWFFETYWYQKSSSVTRTSSYPFFDLSSPRVNDFLLGLWSTLSKIACFCCALLQQEGLIWHLLPSDLWELTDQRWWRGMSSLAFSASVISVSLSPSLAWSSFFSGMALGVDMSF